MTTQTEARDTILAIVETAWTASGAPTETAPLLFPGVKGDKPSSGTWGIASAVHTGREQDTLSRPGRRRFLVSGTLRVQIYTPTGDGFAAADVIAENIKAALDAVPVTSGVWFVNVRSTDVGEEGPWLNVNVEAGFRYQQRA